MRARSVQRLTLRTGLCLLCSSPSLHCLLLCMQSRLGAASRSSLRTVVARFPFTVHPSSSLRLMSAPAPRPGAAADDDVDSLSSSFSSMRVQRTGSQPGAGTGISQSPFRSPRVCRFFHSGRCTWGDKCRDLHTEPPAAAADQGQQQEQQIAPPGGAPVPVFFGYDPSAAAAAASPLPRIPRKAIACQWHATPEGCRRGDACFYMHEPKDGSPASPRARPNQRVPQSEPRQHRGAGAGSSVNHAQFHDPIPAPGFDVPAGAMYQMFSDPSAAGFSAAAPHMASPMRSLQEGQVGARVRALRSAPNSAPAGPASRRGPGSQVVLAPDYLAPALAAPEAAGFRAAGVFAFHRSAFTGRVSVLFGLEGRASKNFGHVNLLGGKVDAGETALQTASREFWEESGTVFAPSAQHVAERLAQGDVLWYRDAKYALHFLELTAAEADIDRRYAAQRARKAAEAEAGGAAVIDVHSEMDELLFIDLYALLQHLTAQLGRPLRSASRSQAGPVLTSVGPLPMIDFTAAMLNCPEVRERMLSWLEATNGDEGRAQAAEIRRAAALKKKGRKSNNGGNWNGEQGAAAAAPSWAASAGPAAGNRF